MRVSKTPDRSSILLPRPSLYFDMDHNPFIKETSKVPTQTKKILVFDSKINKFLEETSRRVFFTISPSLERLRKRINDSGTDFTRKEFKQIIEEVDNYSGRYVSSMFVDKYNDTTYIKEVLDFYKRWPTNISNYCYLYLYNLIGVSRFCKDNKIYSDEISNMENFYGVIENSYNKPGFYISGIKPNNFTNNKIKIERFDLWLEYEKIDWKDQKPTSAIIRGYEDYNSKYFNWYITFKYSKNKYYMSSKNKMNVSNEDINKLDYWSKKFKMPKRELIKFLDDISIWCNNE